MPIRNSVVPSADMFNAQRKKRVHKGENKPAAPDNEPEQDVPEQAGVVRPLPEPPSQIENADADIPESLEIESEVSESIGPEGTGGSSSGEADRPVPEHERETVKTDVQRAHQGKRQQGAARSQRPRRTATTDQDQNTETDQIRLHMDVSYPAAGVSPTFDELVDVQGEKAAFRLVMGRALELFAASVNEGKHAATPASYRESSTSSKTTRMFSKAAYTALEKDLNRTGLLSERAMGTMIGRRALAAFVAADAASN